MKDAACIILTTLKLREDAFIEFQCNQSISLGFNLEVIGKILNCAADEDVLTITTSKDADKATFIIESLNRRKVGK